MSLLSIIPSVEQNLNGFPWKEETEVNIYNLLAFWPRISIVIPSFNQGLFIEKTIRSILLQNYPNLQLIIIDGGSTDNTIEIIKKYNPWISFWVSEKDRGQSEAINKGISKIDGEIFNWICSDDTLTQNSLYYVGFNFINNLNLDILAGRCRIHNEKETIRIPDHEERLLKINSSFLGGMFVLQPSTFIKSKWLRKVNGVDETNHFAMDYDLYTKIALLGANIQYIKPVLSEYLIHNQSKSGTTNVKFLNDSQKVFSGVLNSFPHESSEFIIFLKELDLYVPDHSYQTNIITNKTDLKRATIDNLSRAMFYLLREKDFKKGFKIYRYLRKHKLASPTLGKKLTLLSFLYI
jgi:glycosyltransferase involved in cell wall biosynthesis